MSKCIQRSILVGSALATAIAMTSQVNAAGFQLNEHSAAGLGRAFAGEAVIGDNASGIGRNPALGTNFKNAQASVGLTYIDPEIDTRGNVVSGANAGPANKKDIADSAWIPNAYLVLPVNDQLAVGLTLNSHFGLKTEYGADYAASFAADEAEIKTININPSVAYKVNDDVSVGFGVSVVKAEATLGTSYAASSFIFGGQPNAQVLKISGDDWGYGWNAGVQWRVDDQLRLGLAYRSEVKLTLDGTSETDSPFLASLNDGGKVDLTLPAGAELSAAYQANADWLLSASVVWTDWSVFKTIELETDGGVNQLVKDEYFDDSMRYGVAAEYTIDPKLKWRFGLALDKSAAVDEYRSLSIPDTDRLWISTGITYSLSEKMSIDAAITQLRGDKQKIEEDFRLGDQFVGETSGTAMIYAVSANYSF